MKPVQENYRNRIHHQAKKALFPVGYVWLLSNAPLVTTNFACLGLCSDSAGE